MLKPYLALDLGAGSGRAILGFLERDRLELKEIHRFHNKPIRVNGILYWDALFLWDNVLEALKKCAGLQHTRLRPLGIDMWNVDFGLLDSSGELLYNPVSYRSPVRSDAMELIRANLDEQTLYDLTGIGYMPITGLARLLMRRSEHPNLFSGQACCYLPLPDLLRFFLTGQKNIEETILWGTQLADVRTRDLSPYLLNLFQLPAELFPMRIRSGTEVGEVLPEIKESTGLESAPVMSVAGHDTVSALVSVAGMREGVALLCTGTWFILGKLVQSPRTDPNLLRKGFLNEIAMNGLTYIARNMMGFYFLEGLLSAWEMSYEHMIHSAREAPGFALDIDVNDPSFFASINPSQEIEEYVRRTRQKVPGGRGMVLRAWLEGLAFASREALHDLELLTEAKAGKIVLLGGGARNPLLCQMIACGDADSLRGVYQIVARSFPMSSYEPAATERWEEHAGRRAGHGN
jgi:rhamnulokinase